MKRIWLISDLQVPFHDVKAVNAVAQCISDMKGKDDIVTTVGDEMDFQTIGRWSMGTPLEYERTMGRDRDTTIQVLKDLQVQHVVRSNHTDRLFASIMRRIPGLLGVPELELENFLRLPENKIKFHSDAFRVAPGWCVLHGDESGVSQIAGQTAGNLAKKVGLSVACGHTHRLGLRPETQGINGRVTRTLWGFEVGHLMDMRKALYSKTHNWQQGFGILYVDGKNVYPVPVPILNRSFMVEGKRFTW